MPTSLSDLRFPSPITPEIFLKEYWQQKPLFFPQGLPKIKGLFTPDDILELAIQEEVSARLLKQYEQQDQEKWQLFTSPLTPKDFQTLPEKWTVLVQNMEQWSTELGDLWQAFSFIPQWQRDDIMVSYAPKQGSVGRHYDEYDVFLVQGFGQRRWQLGKWCHSATEFKTHQPIRIFDDMGEIIFDKVMNPGDVLYIPARLAHYGIAQNDCLTFSFGLRYPSPSDILPFIQQTLTQNLPHLPLHSLQLPFRLENTPQTSGLLSKSAVEKLKVLWIENVIHSPSFSNLFEQALATCVSQRNYELLPTTEIYTPDEVYQVLQNQGYLIQDNNSRFVYIENPNRFFVNGQWLDEISPLEYQLLCQLSNGGILTLDNLQKALQQHPQTNCKVLLDSICNWLDDGWVLLYE